MSALDRTTGKHVFVWRFIAGHLPKPLVYWATMRLARHAGGEVNCSLTIHEALVRWTEG